MAPVGPKYAKSAKDLVGTMPGRQQVRHISNDEDPDLRTSTENLADLIALELDSKFIRTLQMFDEDPRNHHGGNWLDESKR